MLTILSFFRLPTTADDPFADSLTFKVELTLTTFPVYNIFSSDTLPAELLPPEITFLKYVHNPGLSCRAGKSYSLIYVTQNYPIMSGGKIRI